MTTEEMRKQIEETCDHLGHYAVSQPALSREDGTWRCTAIVVCRRCGTASMLTWDTGRPASSHELTPEH